MTSAAYGDVPSNTASADLTPADLGPVDVIFNDHRYVREETLFAAMERVERLEEALRKIASPRRPDGTYNLGREACEQIAMKALDA